MWHSHDAGTLLNLTLTGRSESLWPKLKRHDSWVRYARRAVWRVSWFANTAATKHSLFATSQETSRTGVEARRVVQEMPEYVPDSVVLRHTGEIFPTVDIVLQEARNCSQNAMESEEDTTQSVSIFQILKLEARWRCVAR